MIVASAANRQETAKEGYWPETSFSLERAPIPRVIN
jgi:hypothetical protein